MQDCHGSIIQKSIPRVQELEALMTEYLSRDWHNLDVVEAANATDLKSRNHSVQQSIVQSYASLPSVSESAEQPLGACLAEGQTQASDTGGVSDARAWGSQGWDPGAAPGSLLIR